MWLVIIIVILVGAFAFYKQNQLEFITIPAETADNLQKKGGTIQGHVIADAKLVKNLQGLSTPQTFRVDLESLASPLMFPLNIARHMRGHNIKYPAINLQLKKEIIDSLQGKEGAQEIVIMIPAHVIAAIQNRPGEHVITLMRNE